MRQHNWHFWFAWHPVPLSHIEDGIWIGTEEWTWLRWIERRSVSPNDGAHEAWDYRRNLRGSIPSAPQVLIGQQENTRVDGCGRPPLTASVLLELRPCAVDLTAATRVTQSERRQARSRPLHDSVPDEPQASKESRCR